MVNENAQVIGINVAYLSPAQTGAVDLGFAIPSDTAISVADQIIEYGEATYPQLGVFLANLTPKIAARFGLIVDSGALVAEVKPNSPADEAGIERGSVITSVGSEEVKSTGDLLAALREYQPGDRVNLTLVEGGKERHLAVVLEERS